MYVETKTLSPRIRAALDAVGYGSRDIQVVAAQSFTPYSEATRKGARGFTTVINLDTGEREHRQGSWGGSNMFVRTMVDDTRSDEQYPMPERAIVIKGQTGYPRTFATIYCHPNTTGHLLPSGSEETLTDEEQQGLYCFAAIKGGAYRRDELRYRKVSQAAIDGLIERGYLKQSRNGATQITTKGKNARTVRY
jgi:hypothetical protein